MEEVATAVRSAVFAITPINRRALYATPEINEIHYIVYLHIM